VAEIPLVSGETAFPGDSSYCGMAKQWEGLAPMTDRARSEYVYIRIHTHFVAALLGG